MPVGKESRPLASPRRPTITDVARRAGVSKGAVSFALNGRPGVADSTRARILASARELGWVPDHRAQALSRSRALAMGWVIARPPRLLGADPFFPLFLAGLETRLSEAGRALVLHVVEGGPEAEAVVYRRLAAGRADGVFLTDLCANDPRFDLVEQLQIPALGVGRPCDPQRLPWVGIDDGVGALAAVRHLVELGHRRIAHVQGVPGLVHTTSRRRAWETALREAGIPLGPMVTGNFDGLQGAEATRSLLAWDPRPTAIVYANDLMAIAGMQVLAVEGIRVPQDISVVGFDDVAVAPLLHPPLTTVRHDVMAWGRAAASSLLAITDGEDPFTGWLDPAELVVRDSTAPPPTRLLSTTPKD
ncbi:LacI family DNA-binding transcriptional regulator [soil metagenome]|jgi:DNA-binding LacI/PurR family transcriptional regulator